MSKFPGKPLSLPHRPPTVPTLAPIPTVGAPLGLRLCRHRLCLRLKPLAPLFVPRLPVRHAARLLSRRHLITVPDLVTPPTSVKVHVGGQFEAVGAPAERILQSGEENEWKRRSELPCGSLVVGLQGL